MIKAKNDFRINIENIFSDLKLEKISETQQFGVDTKKVILENISFHQPEYKEYK